MGGISKRFNLFILFIFVICFLIQGKYTYCEEKVGIVVSILPLSEFVEKIGKDKVKVSVMVPPGASPHTYEPTPSKLKEVSKAKMYVKVGSGIEFEIAWMDKIISLNRKMLVVDCSKGIDLIKGEEEDIGKGEDHRHRGTDPHIWLSPKNVKIMVENIYEGLVKIDPENKKYYLKNKENYINELDKLDKEISEKLSGKKNRKILVYHSAWAYFCRDYGLIQIPIEKGGKEPTPRGIANLIKQAKENNISIIFASPQFSLKSAETIAKAIKGKVVLIDPLAKNYIENMKKIADAFSEI